MPVSPLLRRVGLLSAILTCLLLSVSLVGGQSDEPGTFLNPLNANGGADPWLTYYEGNYYLATTTWSSTWYMRRSPTLAGLKTAEAVEIYHETDPSRCCNFWAPEFHLLTDPDGEQRWYFYYTAGVAGNYGSQHTHVLESAGTDPLGPYTYKGRVWFPPNDNWMIDGSILELNGELYFLYSAFVGQLQSLFIAPMSNPWTLSRLGTRISSPTYPWEVMGGNVNEGPVALYHDDEVFIVYSASSCNTPNYQLGLLTYTGDNPLAAESWVKSPEPIFVRNDAAGVYAPGHNGFFRSPDGTQDWIVYHANDSAAYGCDGTRSTRVQPITWNEDGTPNFGEAPSLDTPIPLPSGDPGADAALPVIDVVRLQAAALSSAYLRHSAFMAPGTLNRPPLRLIRRSTPQRAYGWRS
ncbi:MAG: glycoside hydrolase family 43 protein [Anaerolineae bacterium]|nr:glycoside hydrolase family 43 protein [Anaerolineae bacterium]